MNKQAYMTDATRSKILDAFWQLFRSKPMEKITAGELAACAGIHRSSFYRYYRDVYQVLDAFKERLLQSIESETINSELWKGAGNAPLLPAYAAHTVQILEAKADMIYRLLSYPECGFEKQFLAMLHPHLKKMLSPQVTDDEYILHLIGSAMISNFTFWYENRERYSLLAINSMGLRILSAGMRSEGMLCDV